MSTRTEEASRPYHQPNITDVATAQSHFQGREIQLNRAQFEATTGYRDDFAPKELPRPTPYQAPPARSPHPFEGCTTHQEAYVPHSISARQPYAPPAAARTPAEFQGTTCYSDDFRSHPLPEKQLPAAPRPWEAVPFEGTTSYQDHFQSHSPGPRQAPHAPAPAARNTLPFQGTSSYQQSFTEKPLPERAPYQAPPQRAVQPFQGVTTNADTYIPHPLPPRQLPAQPLGEGRVPAAFEGTTETQDQYQPWTPQPRNPPPPPPMRPTLPFDGMTTNQELFHGWQLPAKRPSIGIETLGDRLYVLIPRDAPLPAAGRQVFTTVHDNQEEICILIFQGNQPIASQNALLGSFDLTKLPPAPKGVPQIEVTLRIDEQGVLSATAMDTDTSRQYSWLQNGRMIARTNTELSPAAALAAVEASQHACAPAVHVQ